MRDRHGRRRLAPAQHRRRGGLKSRWRRLGFGGYSWPAGLSWRRGSRGWRGPWLGQRYRWLWTQGNGRACSRARHQHGSARGRAGRGACCRDSGQRGGRGRGCRDRCWCDWSWVDRVRCGRGRRCRLSHRLGCEQPGLLGILVPVQPGAALGIDWQRWQFGPAQVLGGKGPQGSVTGCAAQRPQLRAKSRRRQTTARAGPRHLCHTLNRRSVVALRPQDDRQLTLRR